MSVIFPTTPAKVHIQLLPKDAKFISYYVRTGENFILRAWMPAGMGEVNSYTSNMDSNNHFYESECEGCHRNCHSFLSDYRDDDGIVNENHPDLENHCWVYEDGYCGQTCPEGNSAPDENITFQISEMVFEVQFPYIAENPQERFYISGTNAHLRDGFVSQDGTIMSTVGRRAPNVYTSDLGEVQGEICWGCNTYPSSLRECALTYFESDFNNDLLPLSQFERYCDDLRTDISTGRYTPDDYNKFLCSNRDAVIMIEAENYIQAFFTMLSAGFTPIPEAPHIMVIPVKETTLEKGGNLYCGFETDPDSVGMSWFITNDGFLIGQIDNTFTRVNTEREVVDAL